MTNQSKIEPATVADALAELDDLQRWRPALAAFYHATGSFQSAANVDRLGLSLNSFDISTIDGLRAALAKAPA